MEKLQETQVQLKQTQDKGLRKHRVSPQKPYTVSCCSLPTEGVKSMPHRTGRVPGCSDDVLNQRHLLNPTRRCPPPTPFSFLKPEVTLSQDRDPHSALPVAFSSTVEVHRGDAGLQSHHSGGRGRGIRSSRSSSQQAGSQPVLQGTL